MILLYVSLQDTYRILTTIVSYGKKSRSLWIVSCLDRLGSSYYYSILFSSLCGSSLLTCTFFHRLCCVICIFYDIEIHILFYSYFLWDFKWRERWLHPPNASSCECIRQPYAHGILSRAFTINAMWTYEPKWYLKLSLLITRPHSHIIFLLPLLSLYSL